MACVFNGLFKNLPTEYKEIVKNIEQLKNLIKNSAKTIKIKEITVNNEELTKQFLKECKETINNIDCITDGFFISSCDPLLIYYSFLFMVNINHNYNGTIINYINKKASRTVKFYNNQGHFVAR